jgi:hypothetical protein
MAAVMQPPRPSMDRSASFDQSRRTNVNSSQYASPSLQRPSLSQTPSHNSASASAQGTHHRHSFTNNNNTHSRSSSSTSTQQVQQQRPASIKTSSSPYQQPYPHQNQYFPQSQSMYSIPQQPWSSSALPVSQFHASPFHTYGVAGGGGGNQVFHPGFQQSQAEFAAWAGAYGQMIANQAPPQHYGGTQQGMFNTTSQSTEYLHDDRDRARSVSSPQTTTANIYDRSQSPPQSATSSKPPVQAFHPYKRQPGHRPSRENMANTNASVSGMSRSASQPIISRSAPALAPALSSVQAQAPVSGPAPVEVRTETPPPRRVERSSESSERERPVANTRTYANATTGTGTGTGSSTKPSTPLHTGPIANAAANTPAAPRPSPLSNSTPNPPEPEKKEKGFKGRFKKALGGGGGESKRAQSTAPASTLLNSSKSSTPSTRGQVPQHYSHDVPLNPPHAPFVNNQGAMGSDVSLANTERTTTTLTGGPGDEGKEKKRSMFRMKNMSTDNISLSSTVSSASMMIRRMGSIGKLARRNSYVPLSPMCQG